MVADAIASRKPRSSRTLTGRLAEITYATAPRVQDAIVNAGYKLFPDSKREVEKRDADEQGRGASSEQKAFARGDHGACTGTTARRRKHWGWGYEDQQPDRRRARGRRDGGPRAPRLRRRGRGAGAAGAGRAAGAPRSSRRGSLAEICATTRTRARRTRSARPTATSSAAFAAEFENPPDLVARPRDEAEVEAVLAWCADEGAAAIPYGGGTSVVGGVEPRIGDEYAGRGHDRPRRARPGARGRRGLARGADPGRRARARRSRTSCAEHGLTLRHFPQSFEYSTLGGWIATRAGGHFATVSPTSTTWSSRCARSPRPARGRAAGCRARAPGRAPTGC